MDGGVVEKVGRRCRKIREKEKELPADLSRAQASPSPGRLGITRGTIDTFNYALNKSSNSSIAFGRKNWVVLLLFGGLGSLVAPSVSSTVACKKRCATTQEHHPQLHNPTYPAL